MARDPLPVLLRLRNIALDAARRALADRLREESAAAERSAGIAATIARETVVQASQPVERRTGESYVAWLRSTRVAQREAEAAARACGEATAQARVSLNEARTESRALEAALERAADAARSVAARLEQYAVDEAAAGCKRPERWSG
jgi:ABC-type branched-subunit amino acid transport system ATPase component